ncbi:MAG: hypothetical protein WCG29_03045 [Desulfomonile sp.]
MDVQDLSKLRIGQDQREPLPVAKKRRRLAITAFIAAIGVIALGLLAWTGRLLPSLDVATVKVALTFPSRALTELIPLCWRRQPVCRD